MNVTSEQAATAVAERPTSRTLKMRVRMVNEPYPHSAPTARLMTRNAEFLKRLSAKNRRARLSTPASPCQSSPHHRASAYPGGRAAAARPDPTPDGVPARAGTLRRGRRTTAKAHEVQGK